MSRDPFRWLALAAVVYGAVACGSDDPGTIVYFELNGQIDEPATFFDLPIPSDLRLTAEDKPDLTGFPNPKRIEIVDDLLVVAKDRTRWPVMPVVYMRFTAPLRERSQEQVIPADVTAPILLVNVDANSARRGTLVPTIALTLIQDDYAAGFVLAVAPRQGFVLEGDTTYAVVVKRDAMDAEGQRLGVASAMRSLAAGKTPSGALGTAAAELYAPLWPTLEALGIDATEVAAATVFTTGDVVKEVHELSEAVRLAMSVSIDGLAVDPDDGASHERFCELMATVTYPQFQKGNPPFNQEGLFEFGADGLPVVQRQEVAPVEITLPKGEMPAGGYPLMLYFHGSGGLSSQVVDRGVVTEVGGEPAPGSGPANIVAAHGIASAASALPVNPERLPGASDIEYLNFSNLAAFRDTFRQGVIEQRMFLDALLALRVAPSTTSACAGMTLPVGETAFKFNPDKVVALGQSMGGMYTNLISAVEPRITAAVPTGAGGFWNFFILQTSLLEGSRDLLAIILGTPEPYLTFMHPGMHLLGLGWEASEPVVFMPRLARNPLPGHPVRPVYEPVGKGDEYFPIQLYDAVALSYGHREAGNIIWPSMQDALSLADLDGVVPYPVTNNVTSRDGSSYTGVVVQYEGDGIRDPHVIFAQLDEVKYQYGCFLKTFLDTGVATIPAPAPLGTPCPTP